ncbi:hypothetical protein L1987_74195 [Smallanthus sonchifolius]|uniref:Uncharacterized protein n=1 Tax=Smallanthus sonchifolius TaxID=185202 RepID=A0ACB9A1B7_9ASTR|nr:hypothetical protein L1987_74195 [Smallanthus sonchifolius]
MLDLKLVAFLFLISTCFASLVQSDHASISQYTNTSDISILKHKSNANLTTAKWIQSFNSSHINRLADTGNVNVTGNCTREDGSNSKYNDLFLPDRPRLQTLDWVSLAGNRSRFMRWSDPYVNFSRRGVHGDLLHGRGVEAVVFFLARCLYNGVYRKKNVETGSTLVKKAQVQLMPAQGGAVGTTGVLVSDMAMNGFNKECLNACLTHSSRNLLGVAIYRDIDRVSLTSSSSQENSSPGTSYSSRPTVLQLARHAFGWSVSGIKVDKAVEFSYEELSKATHDFSPGNKIGQGGFGVVYYAELRGKTASLSVQKAAIKKMDMQASKEFLAELKVLTHVHHLNLYIENGNLSQHLHGSGREPLPWSTRVQIAIDSARGLEYIHEYTVPVFIHCDIKSANILVDKNFNGKVVDFGLTRLTEVGSRSRLVGTFGYMPLEYAQYGDVSPKVDVYAFGVVLYELISAKKAIIRENGALGEPKGLVTLFDDVLSQADPKDDLVKMIDPRLGDNYPLDSVHKMAQLAKACTHVDPKLRPSMRSIVVALKTLSTTTED